MSIGRSGATLLVFASLILFAFTLAAGCGGNGGQGGQQPETTAQGQGGEAGGTTGGGPAAMIAVGTIESVDPEASTLTLQPTAGEEAMSFMVGPQARISLDNQEASLADATEGQNAQVRYVVREGQNQARAVMLFSP